MKRFAALCALFFILLLSGCNRQIVAADPAPTPELSRFLLASDRNTDDRSRAVGLPVLRTSLHTPYMSAAEKDEFHPDDPVTRGDFCRILYGLLARQVKGHCSFSDLSEGDEYYDAVACLTAWGVVSDSEGAFQPDGMLSRAQLVTMLSAFYPAQSEFRAPVLGSFQRHWADLERVPTVSALPFTDISGHWALSAIENAAERGWVEAGGKFYPDAAVTRAELCRILNRALNRRCDVAVTLLTEDYDGFSDVPADHPYYGDIMEASCKHRFRYGEDGTELWISGSLDPGFHRAGGRLYCAREDGTLRRNEDYGVWHFDETGRYTTGLPELDDTIVGILTELGTDDMDPQTALRAAFLYTTHDHVYIYHSAASYNFQYGTDEFASRALRFIQSGGGYCYDYAACFGLLARSLGFNAYIVKAQVNQYYAPHGWVVIPENGVNYIYDPELESVRPWRHADFGLFRITNYSIYNYWYTPWW